MDTSRQQTGNTQAGVTLIEVVTALFLVGVLAVSLVARDPRAATNLQAQRDTLEKHLRAAQMHAMQGGGIQPYQGGTTGQVFGLRCDGQNYWMFSGIDPDAAGAVVPLLDDPAVTLAGGKLSLSAKKVSMGPFTIYFTGWGIPCTAYTDESVNTRQVGSRTFTLTGENQSRSVTVVPFTGAIQ